MEVFLTFTASQGGRGKSFSRSDWPGYQLQHQLHKLCYLLVMSINSDYPIRISGFPPQHCRWSTTLTDEIYSKEEITLISAIS